MKAKNWMKRLPALALILILVNGCGVFAQGSKDLTSTQKTGSVIANDELLKSLEKALAELESARKINSLQREQIGALEAKIDALQGLVELHKEIAATYKKAAEERAVANTLDDKRVALFEESLAEFKKEVDRLRSERDQARRSRNTWGVVGLVLGIGLGVYLQK